MRRTEVEILRENTRETFYAIMQVIETQHAINEELYAEVMRQGELIRDQGYAIQALEGRVGSYKIEEALPTESDMPSPEHTD